MNSKLIHCLRIRRAPALALPLRAGAVAISLLLAIAVAACGGDPEPTPVPPTATAPPAPTATQTPQPQAKSIVDIAVEDGRFQTLVAALAAAELAETLAGPGPFTVFAPTDEAFGNLPAGTVEALLGDIPALTEILLYHVVSGSVLAADVVTLDSATTLQGDDVSITVDGDTVLINEARVIITDIQAANGTIHVIDSVLLPPQEIGSIVDIALADGRFQTLVTALQAAGLADTLSGDGPFTVFAPTDDAFANLPAGTVEALLEDIPALTEILLYHVVSGNVLAADVVTLDSATTLQGDDVSITVDGDTVRINDASVLITDIQAANGTIHVIDTVLLPQQEIGSIVDIAAGDGRFQALVAALEVSGLVEALMGPGPFTVFAPTDDAFANLPPGTIDALLSDIPALTEILLYHVISGNITAADVARLDSATTLQGDDVSISVDEGTVTINDARVVIADIQAANGTIHVIDTVLLPQQEIGSIVDIAAGDGRFQALVAALEVSGLVEALMGPGPFTVFAPTDEAFANLPAGTIDSLLDDIPALTEILLYHVVPGNIAAADVARLDSATTLQGNDLSVAVDGSTVRINDARVVIADIQAANGTIHVIDSVLLPPQEIGSIVDIAVADGRFQTLVAALQAAGLADTLSGGGPFTVFAPTDDAFAMLPEGTVEALLGDLSALTDMLLYHVVPGNVLAADVVTLDSATTLQGDDVSITADGDTVRINDALVVIADIQAANGTIHVIDSVLLPPQEIGSIVDIAVADGRFQTLVAALQAAGLADTLSGEGPFTVFAPTDDAFAMLPEGTVEALLGDLSALTDILLYHVVPGNVLAADVVALDSATALQGGELSISVDAGTVRINDARVVIADIQAANGTIHVIDSVLIPSVP